VDWAGRLTTEGFSMCSVIPRTSQRAVLAALCLAFSVPLSAAARSSSPSSGLCVEVTSTVVSRAINESLLREHAVYESRLPKGSWVYAYDQYVIEDGSTIAHSPVPSKIVCSSERFSVIDPITGKSRTFSPKARITREDGWMEIGVRPGESIPWILRRDLKLGIAHFKKVICRAGRSWPRQGSVHQILASG